MFVCATVYLSGPFQKKRDTRARAATAATDADYSTIVARTVDRSGERSTASAHAFFFSFFFFFNGREGEEERAGAFN